MTSNQNAGTNTGEDICPKSWKLPSSNDSAVGGFPYLYTTAYKSDYTNFNKAFHTLLAGSYRDGSLASAGMSGCYWSSVPYSSGASYRYNLDLSSSDVGPSNLSSRHSGFTVRCVSSE